MAHATATAVPPPPSLPLPTLPAPPRSMPQAPPVLPPAPLNNRKARLDAAIAHFRSEASASGYVVEEVRLRLPVPDIDVLPRVVIAQNGSADHTPNPPKLPRLPPPLPSSGGVKRTVSGSVILNALSPTRNGASASTVSGTPRKFWTTVIAAKPRESPPSTSPSPASRKGGIPDSHVQLLLSSVAEMPTRATVDTSVSSSASPATSPGVPVAPRVVTKKPGRGRGEGRARPATARPFRCTQCPSSFDREGHLRVHILAVHEKKRPFVCHVCDSAFGHSSSLLRHVRTVHQETNANSSSSPASDRPFRCSACSTAFSRVAQLNRHVAAQHPLRSTPTPASVPVPVSSPTPERNQEPRRTCRICLSKFTTADALIAHVKAKHRSDC